jgi:hypothetical protein
MEWRRSKLPVTRVVLYLFVSARGWTPETLLATISSPVLLPQSLALLAKMTLFNNHEPYPVHLFDTEERSEITVHPPFWTISTLPTGYIKCTPRDALAAFVLPGKPSNGAELFSDEPEENIIPLANLETKAPLFDQGTPARAQSGRARRSRNTSGRSSSTGSAQPRANPPKTTESNPNEKSRPSRAWSPHSKVSGSSRRMTKGADAFWAMHQSTELVHSTYRQLSSQLKHTLASLLMRISSRTCAHI